MSAGSTGIPPLIEQHLLALDRQLRDAAFVRGFGRLVFGVCILFGLCLLLDGWLDLNRNFRAALLIGWIVASSLLLWRCLVRPSLQPISFSTLAALVEQQFPELRERLTSLVELRGDEQNDVAPGASKLMQDLLARQTLKALDQVSVDDAISTRGSVRAAFAGIAAVLLVLAPFVWMPSGYGLLWNRFFVPWGNYAWGTSLELTVLEGDQVVARGSDVTVHVAAKLRGLKNNVDQTKLLLLSLNWNDETGASDSRRLEWDESKERFVTTLPYVLQSLTFQITGNHAKSGLFHIDVSDPPVITQWKLELEPAAYTGLPATSLSGVPEEIRVPEFTRIQIAVEFRDPVATAELTWPGLSLDPALVAAQANEKPAEQPSIRLQLDEFHRTGSAKVTARMSGDFLVRARNRYGLQNQDPARSLVVVPDQPPQILLEGNDDPVLVRPDDLVKVPVEVSDDFGLTAIELHAETSTGVQTVLSVPAEQRRDSRIAYSFDLDLAPFELAGGQVVTYRLRAVDNRPDPAGQEVWSQPRSLVANTTLKQIPDQELAREERNLDEQLTDLRNELNETKAELAKLHQQTEQEALKKQPETDKTEQIEQLKKQQEELVERLERLTDRLAERQMTKELAPNAQQITDGDMQAANERLQQAKDQPAREQLEPLAQAIDRLGAADRQLKQLQQQLNDLNKLEQEIAELSRMAQRAERLADQLEKLERDNKDPETLQKLKEAGKLLADQMAELLRQHPELLDAARRDQHEQLKSLAEQAKNLAEPQQQLAEKLDQLAANSPAAASRPENAPAAESSNDKAENPLKPKTAPPDKQDPPSPQTAQEQLRQQGSDAVKQQEQLARQAAEQAMELARQTGADAEATKAAAEFARKADAARQQAATGQLGGAAKEARDAAKSAEQSARQLNPDGQSNSPQSEQARKLADEQKQAADRLEQLAKSEDATQGAQIQGQNQLAKAASKLAEQFDRAAQALKSDPLNAPKDAEQGDQSKQLVQQAAQSMKQAEQANCQNDTQQAAKSSVEAAQQLEAAADSVKPLSKAKNNSLPVPKEIGTRVTAATKKLETAEQELAKCNCPNPGPGESGSKASSQPSSQPANPSENTEGQKSSPVADALRPSTVPDESSNVANAKTSTEAQPNETGKPGENPSGQADGQAKEAGQKPSQLAQSAKQFRQVAIMLRQIRGEQQNASLAEGKNGQAPGDKSQPADSHDSDQPMATSDDPLESGGEYGNDASGTNVTADLRQLDAELKRQASRNWGRLPGQLRTEILQGAGKKSHPEYNQRIKSYFNEITKPAK